MPDFILTEQQKKAVNYTGGPLLIVAGPGTGKTRVLTEKVLYLVSTGMDPNKILVSTFTVRAADELKERLRKSLGNKVESMQISTIHSFCQKMLETFPEYHNFGNVFKVLDELDQFLYVSRGYWNFGLKDFAKEIRVEDLVDFYNKCTENDVDPNKLFKYYKGRENLKELAIAQSYSFYLANLLNPTDTRLDFALLQREFYHLLLKNTVVLEKVRGMYDYILIDEYQDTNPIQDAIFKLIAEPKYNITVVGDEDQSIYGFRGASIKNFKTFLERYPGSKKIELEENFRSSKEIVAAFENFMRPHRSFEKKIFTKNPEFSKTVLIKSEDDKIEAETLVDLVNRLNKEKGVRFEDIALLFKSVKYHAQEIIEAFEKANIPFVTTKDSSLIEKDEIKEMLLLLTVVNGHEPNEHQEKWIFSGRNILHSAFLNLGAETIEKLADLTSVDFIAKIDLDKLKNLKVSKEDIDVLMGLKNLSKQQNRNPVSQLKLFYKILDATGYHYRLALGMFEQDDGRSEIKLRNLAKLSGLINKLEQNYSFKEFSSFLYQLWAIPDNKMEDAASLEKINAVRLMTVHQAKGLEFPVVVLAGINNKRYNRNKPEEDLLIEIPAELLLDKYKFNPGDELQRVFYVALSRARKLLVLSAIEGRGNGPSEFVGEIGNDQFIGDEAFVDALSEKDHYIPPKEKIKLSYSSVSAYIDCPFRFFLRDRLGFETPIDYFQVYGVIVHNSLKKLHLMIKEGKEVSLQDVIGIVDLYCKDDESRKNWRDELIDDLWSYYQKTSDFIKEVLDAELPFSYINSNIVLNGQVDLIAKNKQDEVEIIDYKSRFKEGLWRMNVDVQLRIYDLALKAKYPKGIQRLSAYTFKDNQRTEFSNTPEDLRKTEDLVASISKDIEKKRFRRNWKGPFCVSKEGRCDFFHICNRMEVGSKDGE